MHSHCVEGDVQQKKAAKFENHPINHPSSFSHLHQPILLGCESYLKNKLEPKNPAVENPQCTQLPSSLVVQYEHLLKYTDFSAVKYIGGQQGINYQKLRSHMRFAACRL